MAFEMPKLPTAFASDRRTFKDPRQHDDKHLRFIRQLPCVVTGEWPVEAAHIRFASPEHGKRETGKSEKPHDRWCLPLSPAAHRMQHSGSEITFWAVAGIDPLVIAARLYEISGDIEEGRRIIAGARRIAS